jgi:hypothetical protein
MYTSVHRPRAFDLNLLRWCARASAVVVVVIWLALVLAEAVFFRFEAPNEVIYQAVALATVFAGYAIGWRKELAGGVIAILGTVLFFVVNFVTIESLPPVEAVWFAAPGVLYLLAWYGETMSGASPARKS